VLLATPPRSKAIASRPLERRALSFVLALACLACHGGCAYLKQRTPEIDACTGQFNSAQVTYRLDAGRLCEPIALARIDGQLVSYEEKPTEPAPDCSVGTLTLVYPHPAGRPGYALAQVIMQTPAEGLPKSKKDADWIAFEEMTADMRKTIPALKSNKQIYEVWTLDLTKYELDQAIGGMFNNGYFTSATQATPGVDIKANIDDRKLNKKWRQVPDLDLLMLRIRGSGQLLYYQRPPEVHPREQQRFSSLTAYREMVAKQPRPNTPPAAAQPNSTWLGRIGVAAPGRDVTSPQIARLPANASKQ
jgi:hypothetical protein